MPMLRIERDGFVTINHGPDSDGHSNDEDCFLVMALDRWGDLKTGTDRLIKTYRPRFGEMLNTQDIIA